MLFLQSALLILINDLMGDVYYGVDHQSSCYCLVIFHEDMRSLCGIRLQVNNELVVYHRGNYVGIYGDRRRQSGFQGEGSPLSLRRSPTNGLIEPGKRKVDSKLEDQELDCWRKSSKQQMT
ncbi:hypothetical protein OIU84_016950 [Salix udensis]|uniref:Uncharacterized protein n=1 Tax=Salix udensis TaxID=889485 RepID=A0AAD6NQG8_9ROSI|nr:hypothetical protein OIU84_016950 [Salix udensis]